ncbi:chromosomal replication initiator protein DnaA [Flavilitoribacter nigricans]|uniref:Chromosomal replication initiator protein DnaA n=1 Tax=Flavilitoribacter nigricans (strain ATCC 23147 / DSM 23189 / NBRC 102662 / NCIMB 1420 / SS-2) TaxID=1122177 RepID=A0A2D0MYI7_FLAN2|nr:chromosomal replication initiator protein DnaA [Flavilitoribacter nigricans]PHN01186.1 chromosomal replication initiator protein DnaA [Flavilitoribacter nigricans DSM 23189 = NBRC 102662]
MVIDHAAVWDNCLQTIRKNVPTQSFRTWFEPIKPVGLEDHALTIQVPNKFFYEWLEEHYVSLLKMTIRKELGDRGRLEYQILMSNGSNGHDHKSRSNGSEKPVEDKFGPGMVDMGNIKNPFVIPGIKKMKIDPQLNAIYTFDTYIEGDCNRLARSAGQAIAKNPGGTSFNPLVIFGDVGLGKTHLAHAVGNEVIERFPNKTVLYVSSEKFTNQIIQSIKNNAVNDFVNFYQLIDVLIVDDIQFLANKQKTQEIFFHIFNQLHQNNRQIILTSDRAPKDLDGMEERLISRFKWGLSADLQAPDLETRMAILEAKMSREGVEIPQNVTEFICYNIKNNIRELEGVLVSLIAQSSLNRREIDVDLAKVVVKNFVTEINKEITVEFIQKLVAEHFSVAVEKLQGKTRKRQVVIARQLSMYLAKNLTDKSLKAIGETFGGRDHSTVIYSCKTVQDLMETDAIFKDTVVELEKKIRMSLNDK